jgi:hypothetical protein
MDTPADAASTRKIQALIQAEAARRLQDEAERLASDAAARSSLLPCPFCGGAVKLEYVSGSYGYTYNSVRIECKACKSTGSTDTVAFSQDTEAWAPGKGTFSIRAQATDAVVARWNRRAG